MLCCRRCVTLREAIVVDEVGVCEGLSVTHNVRVLRVYRSLPQCQILKVYQSQLQRPGLEGLAVSPRTSSLDVKVHCSTVPAVILRVCASRPQR